METSDEEMQEEMNRRIGIQIDPGDNVVTVVEEAARGDAVSYVTPQGSREIAALESIPFGHKIAMEEIPPGERIIKYHEVIGTASRAIKQGEHVHVHNVHSAVQGAAK